MVRRISGMLVVTVALVTAALLGVVGCGGGTGSDGPDFSGGGFVSNDSTTGTLTLNAPTTLQVGDSSGFSVVLASASGSGVADVPVVCDTEGGLALIEPSDGTEGTDSSGQMSGQIGCLQPGSYRMGCRAVNKSSFKTVVCSGQIPPGFGGFPGSGGGGLGGGSGDDGDADSDVSVVGLEVFDVDPDSGAFTIDTVQDADCDDDVTTTGDSEPFIENVWKATFRNSSGHEARVVSWNISVPQAAGSGSADYNSADFDIVGVIPASDGTTDGTLDLSGLLTTGTVGGKTFVGRDVLIPSMGFRNVTFRFTIVVDNADGTTTTLNKRVDVGINFNNIDNCAD